MTAQVGNTPSTSGSELWRLRRELRARRRALGDTARKLADRAILATIRRLPEFRAARHVGVFIPFDGEPSLLPLFATARAHGKRLYAPLLHGPTMTFAAFDHAAPLTTNFFGILEPQLGRTIDARRLDLVLVPLVGFDARGTRLGVGRGYYDRCFAFLTHRTHWRRPRLLGVAYELQRVETLPRRAWDVPLSGVVTEAGTLRF